MEVLTSTRKDLGLFVYDGLIPDILCDEIVQFIKGGGIQTPGVMGDGIVNKEVKHCYDIFKPEKTVKILSNKLSECLNEVMKELPLFEAYGLSPEIKGFHFQKYYKDKNYFRPHFDAYADAEYVSMVYLNSVAEGGETFFHFQDKKACPKKGTVVIFPTTRYHLHEARVPLSDDKYIAFSPILGANNE